MNNTVSADRTILGKDKRFPKQFGDFSEDLVMYVLGQKRIRTALVDHVGADIIATDGNIKYAISVKGRNFPENESKGMRFDAHNIKLLKDFAKSFDMIPAVAFVFTDSMEGVLKIRVFITALDTLIVKAEDTSIKYVHYAKDGGIQFNMQISKRHNLLEQIKSCGEFDYTELEFNSLNDDFRLNI